MLFFASTVSLSCILVAFCHFGNFSAVSKKHVFAAKANEFGMRVSFQHRWNSFHVIASIFMKTKYNHREPEKKKQCTGINFATYTLEERSITDKAQ